MNIHSLSFLGLKMAAAFQHVFVGLLVIAKSSPADQSVFFTLASLVMIFAVVFRLGSDPFIYKFSSDSRHQPKVFALMHLTVFSFVVVTVISIFINYLFGFGLESSQITALSLVSLGLAFTNIFGSMLIGQAKQLSGVLVRSFFPASGMLVPGMLAESLSISQIFYGLAIACVFSLCLAYYIDGSNFSGIMNVRSWKFYRVLLLKTFREVSANTTINLGVLPWVGPLIIASSQGSAHQIAVISISQRVASVANMLNESVINYHTNGITRSINNRDYIQLKKILIAIKGVVLKLFSLGLLSASIFWWLPHNLVPRTWSNDYLLCTAFLLSAVLVRVLFGPQQRQLILSGAGARATVINLQSVVVFIGLSFLVAYLFGPIGFASVSLLHSIALAIQYREALLSLKQEN